MQATLIVGRTIRHDPPATARNDCTQHCLLHIPTEYSATIEQTLASQLGIGKAADIDTWHILCINCVS